MPRRALPPLPGRLDPDSLASHMERFLSALAVRNYSPATIEDRRHSLATFILWCAERGLERPHDVTKLVLERFQRHLFCHVSGERFRSSPCDPCGLRNPR
jgi:integrase/recombinase XerD